MGCCAEITSTGWFIVCALGSVIFTKSLYVSLQGPFYPYEAAIKGVPAYEYGLVFGINALVSFISCLIFGKYVGHIGAKFLFAAGACTTGTCAVLFGLLDKVNSHDEFLTLSFVIRIVESVGSAACLTAGFSTIAATFPDSFNTMFGILGMFYGLGLLLGPSIGGVLFELEGFMLPFTVVGVMLLLEGLFISIALPSCQSENFLNEQPAKMFSVLKLPSVLFAFFTVIATTIGTGYYNVLLVPHLQQFDLSPVSIGGIFAIIGGAYAITAPLAGRLCVAQTESKKVIFLGSSMTLVSFLIVGPAPFIFFKTTLWVVCIGLVFHGLGFACLLISSFIFALQSAIAAGLPEDISTYGIISGISTSAFCLGGFIGPSVAGLLYSMIGFQFGSLFVLAIHFVLIMGLPCLGNEKERPQMYSQVSKPPESQDIEKPLFSADNVHRESEESGFVMVRKTTYGSIFMNKDTGRIRWQRDP